VIASRAEPWPTEAQELLRHLNSYDKTKLANNEKTIKRDKTGCVIHVEDSKTYKWVSLHLDMFEGLGKTVIWNDKSQAYEFK
jgi:hypothetical protein